MESRQTTQGSCPSIMSAEVLTSSSVLISTCCLRPTACSMYLENKTPWSDCYLPHHAVRLCDEQQQRYGGNRQHEPENHRCCRFLARIQSIHSLCYRVSTASGQVTRNRGLDGRVVTILRRAHPIKGLDEPCVGTRNDLTYKISDNPQTPEWHTRYAKPHSTKYSFHLA